MPSIIDILEELEATTGPGSMTARELIMHRHKDNALLKRVFLASLDTYTVYYVNKFKLPTPSLDRQNPDLTMHKFVNELLTDLSTRVITGNAAKAAVQNSFSEMDSLTQKWCQRI